MGSNSSLLGNALSLKDRWTSSLIILRNWLTVIFITNSPGDLLDKYYVLWEGCKNRSFKVPLDQQPRWDHFWSTRWTRRGIKPWVVHPEHQGWRRGFHLGPWRWIAVERLIDLSIDIFPGCRKLGGGHCGGSSPRELVPNHRGSLDYPMEVQKFLKWPTFLHTVVPYDSHHVEFRHSTFMDLKNDSNQWTEVGFPAVK